MTEWHAVSPWAALGIAVFAFAFGVRFCWAWTIELRAGHKKQQQEIDAVTMKVQELLANKKVKRVTIKRREKKR